MKVFSYAVFGSVVLLLAVLFVIALPAAAERAREGHRKVAESACESLNPTPMNSALGTFPAAAPDFTLKDFQGRDVSLSQFRGHVVLVNFWATWCSTCVVEMPSMEKLVAKMKGKPFRLLAVSVDDEWAPIRKFFPRGTSLDVLLDTSRNVPKRWGTEKFPETFIIDKEGTIRYFVVSDRDWSSSSVAQCLDAMMDS
jgi:peroxiredoxin